LDENFFPARVLHFLAIEPEDCMLVERFVEVPHEIEEYAVNIVPIDGEG
jgi:hypothetical protein